MTSGQTRNVRRRHADESRDVRIALIPPYHLLLAAALAVIMLVAAVWSVAGSIRTTAKGEGIIARRGQQVIPVQTSGNGRVLEVLVKAGDRVNKGQIIIRIDQRSLDHNIYLAEQRLAQMKTDLAESEKRFDEEIAAHKRNTRIQLEAIEKTTRVAKSLLAKLKELLHKERELARKRALPEVKVLEQQAEVERIHSEIADYKVQTSQIRSDATDFRRKIADTRSQMRMRVQDQSRKLAELKNRRSLGGKVTASASGVVEGIRVRVGEIVEPDDVLATISTGGPGYELLAFLAPGEGSRVSEGMDASIVPASVQKAQYGSMRGKVESISEGPVSLAVINVSVQNEKLAAYFSQAGPPYMSRIALSQNAANPSGFDWWIGRGTPFPISLGSLAAVEITLEEQAPITLIIPALRQTLGIGR